MERDRVEDLDYNASLVDPEIACLFSFPRDHRSTPILPPVFKELQT